MLKITVLSEGSLGTSIHNVDLFVNVIPFRNESAMLDVAEYGSTAWVIILLFWYVQPRNLIDSIKGTEEHADFITDTGTHLPNYTSSHPRGVLQNIIISENEFF
jgi:hypothetical protein